MKLSTGSVITLAVACLKPALGQSTRSIYEQCAGIGYSGSTQCGPGLACSTLNPYYGQCLQAPTSSPTTAPPASIPTYTFTSCPASVTTKDAQVPQCNPTICPSPTKASCDPTRVAYVLPCSCIGLPPTGTYIPSFNDCTNCYCRTTTNTITPSTCPKTSTTLSSTSSTKTSTSASLIIDTTKGTTRSTSSSSTTTSGFPGSTKASSTQSYFTFTSCPASVTTTINTTASCPTASCATPVDDSCNRPTSVTYELPCSCVGAPIIRTYTDGGCNNPKGCFCKTRTTTVTPSCTATPTV